MDSAEAEECAGDEGCPSYEEYVNACMMYANLNLGKYAPMIDQLTPRAQGTALAAWYNLYAYGEEADVDSLTKTVRPVYLAMRSDVLRARAVTVAAARKKAKKAKKGERAFYRADTRPARCSKPRESGNGSGAATESVAEPLRTRYGISSGAVTESATNGTNAQQAADTFVSLADVVGEVPSSQYKSKTKSKKERKEKSGNVNVSCYEVGKPYFRAECPICGKLAVALFDENGDAYTTDGCGQNGIELPDGYEARSGAEGYTLERSGDLLEGCEHG